MTKEGSNDFSFRINGHKHVFQAASTAERSAWIVAIETKATEAKTMKESVVGGEGYKKNFERFSTLFLFHHTCPTKDPSANAALDKLGVGAATTGASLPSLSKSRDRKETSAPPRKSLETKAKETIKKDKVDSSSASSSDIEKKDKKSKSRSQSRKRSSIFGLLGNKKEEQEEKKELKKEEKAEEKAEKQHDKDISKEHHKHDKDVAKEEKKHEKDVAKEHHKEEKKHEKEIAKEEHKHEKEIAKEEHKHDKELAKEEKLLEKEEKQAEAKETHQPSHVVEAGAATIAAAGK